MNHAKATVTLGHPIVIAEGPPGETGPETWGFYQFPDMWRGRDGRIYLAMNVGADSTAGRHEPTQFFVSSNEGRSWERTPYVNTDSSPAALNLPDGSQVAFGDQRHIHHGYTLSRPVPERTLSALELGLSPAAGPIMNPYGVTEFYYYLYAGLPDDVRRFPVAWRASRESPWESRRGSIDMPDLWLAAMGRDGWWDENGQLLWEERCHTFAPPVPHDPEWLEVLPDGTILWALASQSPGVSDRRFERLMCLASDDGGSTWRMRGTIADDPSRSTWGYGFGEQSLALMPNGDLLCVMRTESSNNVEDSWQLMAARSRDGGHTWSAPEPIAPFSVTPHLVRLAEGTVALVYGRPGVHVRVSPDSGLTWTQTTAVGPPEKSFLSRTAAEWWERRHDYSCANTSVVVTGPDRFLLAYSDFQHVNFDGQTCKAIKVRGVVAK